MNTKPEQMKPGGARVIRRTLAVSTAAFMLLAGPAAVAADPELVKVTELMTRIPGNVPDKEVTMIVVDYAPGGADPVHRHNASAFVYVLEGSIVMQMKGEKEVTLKPGETFYEDPAGVHLVGRNASTTKPAKFLVFLIKEKGAPVLIPVKE